MKWKVYFLICKYENIQIVFWHSMQKINANIISKTNYPFLRIVLLKMDVCLQQQTLTKNYLNPECSVNNVSAIIIWQH